MVIDRLIAAGSESERSMAQQFGVSSAAIHRHKDHVVATVRRSVERRVVERDEQTASVWRERLEGAYGLAERSAQIAAGSTGQDWASGARFLQVMAKLIETGLEVDGVIGPAALQTTTTTVEQVLILPQKPQVFHSETATIETAYELEEPES